MSVEWDSKSRINVFLRPWFFAAAHPRHFVLHFSSIFFFFFVYKCSSFSFLRYIPFVLLKLYFLFGLRNEFDPSPFCFEFSLLKYNIALEKFLLSSSPFFSSFLSFSSVHYTYLPSFFPFCPSSFPPFSSFLFFSLAVLFFPHCLRVCIFANIIYVWNT